MRKQSVEIHQGHLILVNDRQPLHRKYRPDLVAVEESAVKLERRTATMLELIRSDLKAGQEIVLVSGFRDKVEQECIFQDSLEQHGVSFTKQYVARPMCSEHQSGLAIDLGVRKEEIDFLCPDFPDEGLSGLFKRMAANYGFIERYPKGKEQYTHINHEPWHYRYVGTPHAEYMERNGLCLEEYHDLIRRYDKDFPLMIIQGRRTVEVFYVPQNEWSDELDAEDTLHQVSGNNKDGFIITRWK